MTDVRNRVVIAAGFLISLAFYTELPGPFLPRNLEWPLVPPLIAFTLPTAATVTYVILIGLWKRERTAVAANEALDPTLTAIAFRIVLFVVALQLLLLTGLTGAGWVRVWAGRGVVVLLGLLLISIGNLLPCTRPNVAIGIRTARTLQDRGFWMHVHRTGGNIAVGLGAVVVYSGAFLGKFMLPRVISAAGLGALILLVASYRRYLRA